MQRRKNLIILSVLALTALLGGWALYNISAQSEAEAVQKTKGAVVLDEILELKKITPEQEAEKEFLVRKLETLKTVERTDSEGLYQFTGGASEPLKDYLHRKGSPLVDYAGFIMNLDHWQLIIALAAAESSFCKKQPLNRDTGALTYNCWGVGGDDNLREYSGYKEALIDIDMLITSWQARGRWLTVSDMNRGDNASYVYPYNLQWEKNVNAILEELNLLHD